MCECVDYIYVLFVVVYVVVSMCVYADTCATWQILGCLMNMCSVAICSGSCRTVGDLVGWFFFCVVMILTKGQIYHHHCIMKKMIFFKLRYKYKRRKWMLNLRGKKWVRWKFHGVKRHGVSLSTMVCYAILVFICLNMFCVKLQYVRFDNLYWLPMLC